MNPNGDIIQNQAEDKIMKECFKNVESCDIVIFSSLSGIVGKGVADEVSLAFDLGKLVYYIFEDKLISCETVDFTKIEETNTQRLYATVSI